MPKRTKLIVLNGAAGIGKTTIARRYVSDKQLTLCLEADQLITMICHWQAHETVARKLVYEYMTHMIEVHLEAGYEVVLPYLVSDVSHLINWQQLADERGADFIEIMLYAPKEVAVRRLLRRGTWGEADAPPMTDSDRPVIETLYDTMMSELAKRPTMIRIDSKDNDIDQTYNDFLTALSASLRG